MLLLRWNDGTYWIDLGCTGGLDFCFSMIIIILALEFYSAADDTLMPRLFLWLETVLIFDSCLALILVALHLRTVNLCGLTYSHDSAYSFCATSQL